MRKTEEHEIAGRRIAITQMGYRDAREVFVRLTNTIGPSLAELAAALPSLSALADPEEARKASAALRGLLLALNDNDLEFFAEKFGRSCQVLGADQPKTLDEKTRNAVFDGALLDSFLWLKMCIQVNYADFFAAFGSLSDAGLGVGTPKAG